MLLAVAAAWAAALDQATAGVVLAVAAIAILVVALTTPRFLGPANRILDRFQRGLGFLLTHLILGLIYFVIMTPLGLLRRLLARGSRPPRESYWVAYPARRPEHYERMF
jgi:hypothetical protein